MGVCCWNRATQPPPFSLLAGEILILSAGFVLFSTVVLLGDLEIYFFVPVGIEAQGKMVEQVDLDRHFHRHYHSHFDHFKKKMILCSSGVACCRMTLLKSPNSKYQIKTQAF